MPSIRSTAKKANAKQVVQSNVSAAAIELSEAQVRAMPESEYMKQPQLDFFRARLLEMREEVLSRQAAILEQLNQHETAADPADQATNEEEYTLALRLREREFLLMRKIDESLARIRSKEYGYCEKTGEPIGIPRLIARPTASVCVQVKDHDERAEVHFRSR
jgi:DnaK suppressor protein